MLKIRIYHLRYEIDSERLIPPNFSPFFGCHFIWPDDVTNPAQFYFVFCCLPFMPKTFNILFSHIFSYMCNYLSLLINPNIISISYYFLIIKLELIFEYEIFSDCKSLTLVVLKILLIHSTHWMWHDCR